MPRASAGYKFALPMLLAATTIGFAVAAVWAAEVAEKPAKSHGEQIYRQQCASCHGAAGEGVADKYPRPLAGDKSVEKLAAFIEDAMPEDDPGTCTGDDAKNVAQYIYDAFYSPAARAKKHPSRVELSRLTANQYVNVVADLLGSFRNGGSASGAPRGLRASYVAKHRNGDHYDRKRPVEHVDPCIDFAFGPKGPLDGRIATDAYEIGWRGTLAAPESGEYEFDLDTCNGARLWINDRSHPLIDAWVRSNGKSEHRQSIRLLAGRRYPIRVEFVKGKGEAARIALRWKPPQLAEEVVPARCLSTADVPEVFVLQTPLPADDRSAGYERGTTVSKQWQQAITDAAIEVAGYVAGRYRQRPELRGESLGHDTQTREFCRGFVERAFRRPLNAAEGRLYIDRRFENAPDLDTAVRRVVLFALISPRFLYVPEDDDQRSAASRLALVLWDSLPDETLRQAAATGKLGTAEQLRAEARRMLADPRAAAKLRLFFMQWMKVETPPDLAKDPKTFAAFDANVAADLRTSLAMLIDDVLWSKESDFRQLLLADYTYMNGRLAKYYGLASPVGADFEKVVFEPQERAGILSHPYLMATFAHAADSSPIHRGVFITRGVLGMALRPPPMAIAPLTSELKPDLTTRQRVELQTQAEACQSCHGAINPLGFALEHFDAAGRLRQQDRGRPIDATGSYVTRDGREVKFCGVRDLARFLAGSEEVHRAFIEQLFRYLVKQPVQAYGANTLPELERAFADSGYNMQELVVEIAARAARP